LKILVAIVFAFQISNAISCDNLELKKSSLKADIYYQYAPFGKLLVAEDHLFFSTDKPNKLTINFVEEPYSATVYTDIHTSTVNDHKIAHVSYEYKNTESGVTYSNQKVVMLEDNIAKVSMYDWKRGKKIILHFSEYTDQEWNDMDCPSSGELFKSYSL